MRDRRAWRRNLFPAKRSRLGDHDRANPNLTPAWPTPSLSNHPFLADVAKRVKQLVYVDRRTWGRPLLWRRRGRGRGKIEPFTISRRYSSRAAAHVRFLLFTLSRLSLPTLTVGDWFDGEGEFYDLEGLSKGSGLRGPLLDRVISDLVAAGWIYRRQTRDYDPASGKFEGHVSDLKFTEKFFDDLGVLPARLKLFQGRAVEDEHQRQKKRSRQAPASPVRALISHQLEPAIHDLRPEVYPGIPEARALDFNISCFEIGRDHPEWDADQVRAEAARRLRPPDQR